MSNDTLFFYYLPFNKSFCYISIRLLPLKLPHKANPMKQLLLLSHLAIILHSGLLAQKPEPVFRWYSVDNGLAASEVYHVFQDSKGYVWFATSNGVSRYDGYAFENLDLETGLVDNTVFEIYEDYKHRVWFIPLSGKLAYYENGKVFDYMYNKKIKDHLPSSRGPVKMSFYVDTLDNIYLGLKQFGIISITPDGVYRRYAGIYNEGEVVAQEISPGKIIISNPLNAETYDIIFNGLNQKFRFTSDELYRSKGVVFNVFMIIAPDSSVIISSRGMLFRIKDQTITARKAYDHQEILWISLDRKGDLWVAPQKGGVECYPGADFEAKPSVLLLQQVQVTSVLHDNEGSYWFSTLNDGVFYYPNIKVTTHTKGNGLADNRVNAVLATNEGVFVGYEMGFVDKIQGDQVTHYSIKDLSPSLTSVRSLNTDPDRGAVWACSATTLNLISNNRVKYVFSNGNPRKIVKSRYGGYWLATVKGLKKIIDDRIVYDSYERNEYSGLIFALLEDSKGAVWFCGMNGLWKYHKGVYQHLGSENPLLSHIGNSMFINPEDSSIWIGTNGAGIVIYKQGNVSQITTRDGLVSNSIHQLFYSPEGVWVATRQGLSRVISQPNGHLVNSYTIADGLPTNEVTSVYVHGQKVYAGTGNGLAVFNINDNILNSFRPAPEIKSFIVNNQRVNTESAPIALEHYQNILNFNYIGLLYRNERNVKYRYRVLGLDSAWIQTYATNCLFTGLKPGHYTFELQAQNSSGLWSENPTRLHFTIEAPFWQKAWFLTALSLISAFAIYMVFKVRVAALNRKNELLNNINLYKQQSLRQQMNPHFIFNTLNSIQLYILEKDPISAHKYLTKFSRLMRVTLDNSLYPTIPLRDEIEGLELYLELEALRLEGKFSFQIDLGDDDRILDVKIPTLLIQPFVENAIWHGIMLKESQSGYVKIKVSNDQSLIICSIEDNGIGREAANRIRQTTNKTHKSRGSQITQQRIDLLNSLYKEKFNIQYIDLFDSQSNPCGTIVRISIPKELEKRQLKE